MRSYAVVALFDPLHVGTSLDRRAWPAHVALASVFTTASAPERIIHVVADADPAVEPLSVRFGEQALFGPDRDVPVRLVDSAEAVEAHLRLADRLESLPGFVADEPAYWRDGYRPHVTLGPSVSAAEGDRLLADLVAIVEILGADAAILALLRPLQREDPEP